MDSMETSSLPSTPSGRRRGDRLNAEDETLSQIAKEAEAKLAQKRAARLEAREIRMRELERQQREAEEKAGKDTDSIKSSSAIMNSNHLGISSLSMMSRRSSDDSTVSEPSVKELRESLTEMEEKYKRAMVQNAQLDNERMQLNYRVEQLKDIMEENEDKFYRLKKDFKEKNQDLETSKRMHNALQKKYEDLQEALRQRDELIQEQGLVMVGGNMIMGSDDDEDDDVDKEYSSRSTQRYRPTLLSQEAAQLLESAGDGTLESRLKNLAEEKKHLTDEVRRLQNELDEERSKDGGMNNTSSSSMENGVSDMMLLEIQREASKQISDYKFKLQQAEQEIGSYQANITRFETQLQRYKATAEVLEKSEDEMRAEKRKLQRDLRSALDRIEEMQMTNAHLEKRLEKMRAARNAQASLS